MKKVLFIVLSALLATVALGYLHLEDFQSYDDGENIADSADWDNWSPPNDVCCVDLGYGVKIGCLNPHADDQYWNYKWEASESACDYGISCDFSYSGDFSDTAGIGIFTRINGEYPGYHTCYSYGVIIGLNEQWLHLGVWGPAGLLETLWQIELVPVIPPEEWHNLEYYVFGESPVNFEMYLDGEFKGYVADMEWFLTEGTAGIGAYDSSEEPESNFLVDNVMQLELPEDVGITPVSFGRMKAVFAE